MKTKTTQDKTVSEVMDLVAITETQKLLVGFKEKYAEETLPTADTKEGYYFLKVGVAELRDLRGRTEDHRKVIVAPMNKKVKEVNALAKEVIEELALIEEPMKVLKAVEDDRLKAIKEEKRIAEEMRIRNITRRLGEISSAPLELMDASPADIQKTIDDLMLVNPEEDFDEFINSAIDTVSDTLDKLRSLYAKAVDQAELAEAKRIQEEEERKAQAIQAEKDRVKAEEEAAQRRKDEAELEALRAEKAERAEAERKLSEHNTPPDTFTPTMKVPLEPVQDIEPPVPADSKQTPLDKRQEAQLNDIQEDLGTLKEHSILAIEESISREMENGRAVYPSAMAKVLFDAIYTDQIPNIKFQIPA